MTREFLNKAVPPGLKKVKNLIAVGSGKGGVGKSTLTTLLAYGLKEKGFKVGVLDTDVYGPSQIHLMGRPDSAPEENRPGEMMAPISRDGISYLSMAAFKQADSPTILRAPMVVKWLQYFMGGVNWGELDFLLLDLPPGTGDVQLTIAQQSFLHGAVIVTTANPVACDISFKGLMMFKSLNIPIVGVVENMSALICEKCEHENHLYTGDQAKLMAKNQEVPFLGDLPMHPLLAGVDEGVMAVLNQEPLKPIRKKLESITNAFLSSLEKETQQLDELMPEEINISAEGGVIAKYRDGKELKLDPMTLRKNCPCAACVDENTGKKILQVDKIPLNIKVLNFRPTGRYGLSLSFSDGHGTGIYRFSTLQEMA